MYRRIFADIKTATDLDEHPRRFGDHVFVARRNADQFRYQVFRDAETTPIGYVEAHQCPFGGWEWRLRVFGADGHPIGLPDKHSDDHPDGGCVHSYVNALSHLTTGQDR